ncbi:MAG: septum formation initiator family protein [Alphaproteobacteria bacterium]|nr:septum formation initiator family protein [Rickettsiales bacterium]
MYSFFNKTLCFFSNSIHVAYSKYRAWVLSFTLLFFYLIGGLIAGQNGIINHYKLQKVKKEKTYILHKLEKLKDNYTSEINRLSTQEIDIDYLDELARSRLNYAKPNEIIITY